MATTDTTERKLLDHRFDVFLELGFDLEQAETLAHLKVESHYVDRRGKKQVIQVSLPISKVSLMLAQGATHAQVLAIFV